MANLIGTEPALFNADEEWLIFDDGRKCLRKKNRGRETSSGFTIMSDHIDPVRSMADGKIYDSKSALYRTYKADGNPQGVNYVCVGNENTSGFTRPKRDKASAIAAVKRALGDL